MRKKRTEGHDAFVGLEDYIKSEQFIWDDLIAKGVVAVRRIRENWKKKRSVTRSLLAFPAEHVKADDGSTITHVVSFEIPDGMATFDAAVALSKRAKAYALLLMEREGDKVKVLLESHHGTRCWTIPVAWHGDIEVLGKEEASSDAESIGVLWRPRSAKS